ncbi:MAG TPA: cobalamin-dependent protein [Verrucomicrobiae bacterium]|nr:cobalamin-dependent protein [Verrucomicrobiae bacterium]
MRLRRGEGPPIRLLTAVPICDRHDSAINTLNLEFIRHGIEVIYLGYHRSARDIVRAAIQEDARAIGISSYNGGHIEFFAEVLARLKQQGASSIGVFGGGGGTITRDDAARMKGRGVDEIFFAGTPLPEMVEWVKRTYRSPARSRARGASSDRQLARLLSSVESCRRPIKSQITKRKSPIQVLALSPLHLPLGELSGRGGRLGGGRGRNTITIGITGPGGAGKTTLIDELVLRFLKAHPDGRLAILSHDPSVLGHGALLGDRASMIHSQDDRVFMRSLATRGRAGGLSAATETCLRVLKQSAFDLVLVETVGIGQEALPFGRSLVDKTVLVMSPDYGSRLQLQKIVMLDRADLVVVNKSDLPGARTAVVEVEQRLSSNRRGLISPSPPSTPLSATSPGEGRGLEGGEGQKIFSTTAKRHRDAGVDALFRELMS